MAAGRRGHGLRARVRVRTGVAWVEELAVVGSEGKMLWQGVVSVADMAVAGMIGETTVEMGGQNCSPVDNWGGWPEWMDWGNDRP